MPTHPANRENRAQTNEQEAEGIEANDGEAEEADIRYQSSLEGNIGDTGISFSSSDSGIDDSGGGPTNGGKAAPTVPWLTERPIAGAIHS